ncbi:MAG: hypothetical protein Q8O88_03870 [bacterium]|nr:hypothetical protein [bacterium]
MPLGTSPKLELKNVKTFRGMEGHGLNADLYVDGKRVCFVMDEGNGGCFNYQPHGKEGAEMMANRETINELHNYARSLPKRLIECGNGKFFALQPNLDTLINDAYSEVEKAKSLKKIEKKMTDHIMWGLPDGDKYSQIKLRQPINLIDRVKLQEFVDKLKRNFTTGEQFLNTNLQALGIVI